MKFNRADIDLTILAGGYGTRLRAVLPDTQKVVAPVGGKPFLHRILQTLIDNKFVRVTICLGHLAKQVQESCREFESKLLISYSFEQTPLGTAGAIRNALSFFSREHVLILNGDSYSEIDFELFLESFHPGGVYIALKTMDDVSRYGSVKLDESSRIIQFEEKGRAGTGLINAGAYLLDKQQIYDIPEGQKVSLETEVFPKWSQKGILYGTECVGNFIDIGTPESYSVAKQLWTTSD